MNLPKPRIVMSRTQHYDRRSGTPSACRVVTSRNRNPYHYVTHGSTFEYNDYGVHRGQFDRLSFFATESKAPVSVHIYDCREDSDELDRKFVIDVPTDGSQILEIPPGYAHWFTGLENVATRNDYSILAPSSPGSKWNAMNDDTTVSVAEMEVRRPRVRANDRPLPMDAQFLISRMVSESWSGGVSRGAAKMRVRLAEGEADLLVADSKDFGAEVVISPTGLSSAQVRHGSFQQVREESVTVASHVPSGIAQTLFTTGSAQWPDHYSVHPYITMQLSSLTVSREPVMVDLIDRRVDSDSYGERVSIELPSDPRLCLRIAPGVMWRMLSPSDFYYRVEYEIHEQAPGQNLPAFVPVPAWDAKAHSFTAPGERVTTELERMLAVDE